MRRIIKVGTRESMLAMAQTGLIINAIKEKHPELEFEIIRIKTTGDVILNVSLDKIGGKGLFTKELETALLSGTIDLAVHSVKDMPVEIPEGLVIAAVSKREDPRDVLVTLHGQAKGINDIPPGSVVGTSSIRRELQLLDLRPDLKVKTLRGNVVTRLEKLARQEYDALILAAAGLKRLGMEDRISEYFEIGKMIPAAGQGILGIETRKDFDAGFLLDSVHCRDSELEFLAERTFMIRLNGGCSTPVAVYAVVLNDKIKIYGMFAEEQNPCLVKDIISGSKHEAVRLAEMLADQIISRIKTG